MKTKLDIDRYALFVRGEVGHLAIGEGYLLIKEGSKVFIVGNGQRIFIPNSQYLTRIIELL